MANEFTVEELREAIRAARIFNRGFSEEQFQSLAELQARLPDSGYLETVNGLQKLEKETGVSLDQVFETRDRLLQENEELKQMVADHNAEVEALEERLIAAEKRHRELLRAIQDEAKRLEHVRRERASEEKELAASKKKAARERERIDKELDECRRKAEVTEAEVATAGQVKAEVTKHGFTVEMALGLAHEFAGYGDARDRLAEALKKDGELTSHLAALEADLKALSEDRRHMEGVLSRLATEQEQHEIVLSQLKAEIAEKSELVGFYHRYVHLRSLIEYLGSSSHLTFHHCVWCGALFWVLRPGNVSSSAYKCPWCGFASVEADRNAYAAVEQTPGTPLKLLP